ncbi:MULTISPECIES: cytochrome P450 [Streptomyces]|uniref:Cytochrome P450 n=1 Tax=Streptomyces clavifer TaxID=68188 RepID=A0ABS4VF70_9ACTN|nr:MULTISPECIES: cytochrome P450 [Streptomyces]KQX89637.1 cytochrome P450 [Streptomyces sp. Root1319]KQZ20674.1 cytochrome P450 [Streptomyces sp. Root55]MBP2362580.1 cytochrome P450 [Streptomyces clavifer]MDX2745224.1 cytochrome P450 [Streptomyces sp. NRRL_B-2557]MDX3062524.1 cytochrome P450 [Streptomyces sp. ND04-05B]
MTDTSTATTASVPLAPQRLPLLGHALPLLRDPLAFIMSLSGYRTMVRVRLGPSSAVMICDPDLTRQVFLNDRVFDKGGPIYDRIREVIGDGLSTCSYTLHRRQRRLCQPSFHPARLPGYGAVFAQAAELKARSWRDGDVLDITQEMMTLTTRATMQTMFSGALPEETMRRALADTATIVSAFFRRMMTPALLRQVPTPQKRRYDRARKRLSDTIAQIIAERRADPTDHADLLSALVGAVDEESEDGRKQLSDGELADEALTFFLGGMETTAITLAWALHLLATDPDVQHRLQVETDNVLKGEKLDPAHLPSLGLAGRVVTETLRLYPPAWMMTRTVRQDAELGGVRLKAGSTLVLSPYLLHRRPDLYTEPDRFDPDRWLDAQPDRATYIPFGAGPRKCIGDQFALTEAILALTAIVARWELTPVGDKPFRPKVETSLSSRGLSLRLGERWAGGAESHGAHAEAPAPARPSTEPGVATCPVKHQER